MIRSAFKSGCLALSDLKSEQIFAFRAARAFCFDVIKLSIIFKNFFKNFFKSFKIFLTFAWEVGRAKLNNFLENKNKFYEKFKKSYGKTEMLAAIAKYYKIERNVDFARFFGLSEPTALARRKKGMIDFEQIYEKCPDISPDWLLSKGEGPMLRAERIDCNNINFGELFGG